ncbi:hypothetical protein BZA77DRAFT_289432 [Pyronema omphalodes]|nr:hypothetical protein BZA77DRAFT_289432 [Pyronema omphalodes]
MSNDTGVRPGSSSAPVARYRPGAFGKWIPNASRTPSLSQDSRRSGDSGESSMAASASDPQAASSQAAAPQATATPENPVPSDALTAALADGIQLVDLSGSSASVANPEAMIIKDSPTALEATETPEAIISAEASNTTDTTAFLMVPVDPLPTTARNATESSEAIITAEAPNTTVSMMAPVEPLASTALEATGPSEPTTSVEAPDFALRHRPFSLRTLLNSEERQRLLDPPTVSLYVDADDEVHHHRAGLSVPANGAVLFSVVTSPPPRRFTMAPWDEDFDMDI